MDYKRVEGCEVCDLLEKGGDLTITQNEFWRVELSPDQFYLGRAYVTARNHVPSLSDLSAHEWSDFMKIIKEYEASCLQLGATHVTWAALMNNAYREVEPKPHVHWHVRPRYQQPIWMIGRWFVDPDFGSHHQRSLKITPRHGELLQIAERLKPQPD